MQTTLKVFTIIVKVLSVVAGGSAYLGMLPESWAPVALIVFGIVSIAKDSMTSIGDLLDDGQKNGSFK